MDHWVADSGRVTRVHVKPRNSLFMAKVDDVSLPWQSTQELGRARVTKGTDHLGNKFVLQDYWQAPRRPTRKQPFYWTGTTSFQDDVFGPTGRSPDSYECLRSYGLGERPNQSQHPKQTVYILHFLAFLLNQMHQMLFLHQSQEVFLHWKHLLVLITEFLSQLQLMDSFLCWA